MGILADWQIKRDIGIRPFAEYDREAQAGKISFGLSSYGYDARVGHVFEIFSPIGAKEIDPKNFDPKALVKIDLTPVPHTCGRGFDEACLTGCKPDHILIPPHSFALAETFEEFEIPRDILVVVVGKSTLARCGIIVNVTPLEPEWRGKITVEISNTTPLPVRIYAGEGIMQCLFLRTDGLQEKLIEHLAKKRVFANEQEIIDTLYPGCCEVSYADKKGKYQDQAGLTHPRVIGQAPPPDAGHVWGPDPNDPGTYHCPRCDQRTRNPKNTGHICRPRNTIILKAPGLETIPEGPDPTRDPESPQFDPATATRVRPRDPNRIVTDRTGMTWRWHEDEGKWRMAGQAAAEPGEIVLDNSDPRVPDEVLSALRTRILHRQPLPAPWQSNSITSDAVTAPRSPTTAPPPPEPRDPNLPPDPPPPDYVTGLRLWVGPDGAGWRYNPKNRTWVQVTDPR